VEAGPSPDLASSCGSFSGDGPPGWAQGLLSPMHYLFFFQLSSTCQLVLGVVERADHLARETEKNHDHKIHHVAQQHQHNGILKADNG